VEEVDGDGGGCGGDVDVGVAVPGAFWTMPGSAGLVEEGAEEIPMQSEGSCRLTGTLNFEEVKATRAAKARRRRA
jgi:hypothetical protein